MEPFEFRFIVDPGSVKSHEYNENNHESFTNNYDESLSSQGTGKLNNVDRQFPFMYMLYKKQNLGLIKLYKMKVKIIQDIYVHTEHTNDLIIQQQMIVQVV